jgi:hypothetical protein
MDTRAIKRLRQRYSEPATIEEVTIVDLLDEIEQTQQALRGFLDYYDPHGGVSAVPLGPFQRAREALGDPDHES